MSATASPLLGDMLQQAGRLVAPLFLACAIVLGGASRGGFIANGVLQGLAAVILVWCLLDQRLNRLTIAARWLIGLAIAFFGLVLLQLVPLPPSIWTQLPGRSEIAEGYRIAGMALPDLPLSLAPEETLNGLLWFLPPLAAFVLIVRAPWRTVTAYLRWAIALCAVASVLFGLAQVIDGGTSVLYLYASTNRGLPVGFFANVNHQATLLLMATPFLGALAGRLHMRVQMGDGDVGQGIVVASMTVMVALGIMIAGSVAGYVLFGPAVVMALVIAGGRGGSPVRVFVMIGIALALAMLGFLVANSPMLSDLGITNLSASSLSRPDIFTRTLRAIGDFMPLGSGLGSFEALYPRCEDPTLITSTFVNHAHNDYLEIALELGVPGIGLLVAVVIWWGFQAGAIWRSESGESIRLRKAATVALGLVLLHSLADYPLRTGAVATFAAICLGLMAGSADAGRRRNPEPQPARHRHVTI